MSLLLTPELVKHLNDIANNKEMNFDDVVSLALCEFIGKQDYVNYYRTDSRVINDIYTCVELSGYVMPFERLQPDLSYTISEVVTFFNYGFDLFYLVKTVMGDKYLIAATGDNPCKVACCLVKSELSLAVMKAVKDLGLSETINLSKCYEIGTRLTQAVEQGEKCFSLAC